MENIYCGAGICFNECPNATLGDGHIDCNYTKLCQYQRPLRFTLEDSDLNNIYIDLKDKLELLVDEKENNNE